MYGVIIADDETKVRNAVKLLGDWDGLGLQLLCETENGDDLCRQAEALQPDILITDMRMPGLSGSALIRELTTRFPNSKIIIISGFDDFEYTRQAITSKVVDYILKPIDEDNLNHALQNAIREIDGERSRRQESLSLKIQLNEALPYMKEKLFNKFVDGEDILEEEFLKLSRLHNGTDGQTAYTLAVLLVENFQQVCRETFHSDSQTFCFALLNVISELLNGRGIPFFKNGRGENEIVVLFCGEETRESLFLCMNDIKDQLLQLFKARVFSGIGRTYPSRRDVGLSLNEARIVLQQMNILEYKRIAFYEDMIDLSSKSLMDFQKYEGSFLAALENGNTVLLKREMDALYEDILSSGQLNIRDIKKLNADMLFLLERLIEHTEGKSEILPELFLLREKVDKELDVREIRDAMGAFIESASSYIGGRKKRNETGTIYSIQKYIRSNYTSKFTLGDLSRMFYWSGEYISKMFKEEFNCNLFDYVAALKIEKAKELLLEQKKASEIVSLLGFSDESHFSKTFKKVTGMSPRAFKGS